MNSSKKIMNQAKKETEKKGSTGKISVPEKKLQQGGLITSANAKPIILGALCILTVLVLCIGVGMQQLKPKNVLTVDKTKFTMNDMMYPIYEVESQYLPYNEMYESYTGKSVWEAPYQGAGATGDSDITNAIGLKQALLNSEVQYEILYQKAVKANYKLTDKEKKDAEKKVDKALKGLSWLQKLRLNISKSNLTDRFEKRALADRFKEDTQKDLNKKVDEAKAKKDIKKKDYRQYDIQYYSAPTTTTDSKGNSTQLTADKKKALKEKLLQIAKKAKKADDFTKLTDKKEKEVTFEKAGKFTEKDGWTYVSKENLKKIKAMKNGEVSNAFIDDKTGYYVVVKMINNNSEEAYKSACDQAIKSAQDEAYQTWYQKEQGKHKVNVNEEIWTDVTIGTVTTEIVTAEDLQDMKEASSDKKNSKSKK